MMDYKKRVLVKAITDSYWQAHTKPIVLRFCLDKAIIGDYYSLSSEQITFLINQLVRQHENEPLDCEMSIEERYERSIARLCIIGDILDSKVVLTEIDYKNLNSISLKKAV